jgi:nicotinate-nucleotide pyrophosphorylase (carboxylating)
MGVSIVNELDVDDLVARSIREDLGAGDVTSEAVVAADARARASVIQKAAGVVFGLEVALGVFRSLDPQLAIVQRGPEGEWRETGAPVLEVSGDARALLAGERTALNFLAHLSGIATATALAVRALEGTGARVLDTRKTTPGLRALEKAAVAAGGGFNHRFGLHDAILIKENHIAAAGGIAAAVLAARRQAPDLPLEVEVRDPGEIAEALAAGAEQLLLDNMTPEQLRAAVAQVAGRATLEASGNVTLATLREVGSTGVDFVSMGALTHSAPALDLSLGLELLR